MGRSTPTQLCNSTGNDARAIRGGTNSLRARPCRKRAVPASNMATTAKRACQEIKSTPPVHWAYALLKETSVSNREEKESKAIQKAGGLPGALSTHQYRTTNPETKPEPRPGPAGLARGFLFRPDIR